MRNFLILLAISVVSINGLIAQDWVESIPQNKVKEGTITFQDIQNAFYQAHPKSEVPNGQRMVNGQLEKVAGWKLFKRWEWYWESRVDKATGQFPDRSALDELLSFSNRVAINGGGDWTNLGPTTSPNGEGTGRINCIAFHPTNNSTYWIGSPSGGLFKTTNDGSSWTVLTDDNDVLGVSAIAIAADYETSNTIFIGTGDRDEGSLWTMAGGQFGDNGSVGILKSTDDGETWSSTGLTFAISAGRSVNRILIDPTNSQNMLAATSVGIYQSTNGGSTWSKKSTSLNFTGMEYKPGDPSIIYASTKDWSTTRIYRSTNGGTTWSLEHSKSGRRTEIAVSASQPTWVYAVVANANGGLEGIYKSTNSGASFSVVYSGGGSNKSILGYYCNGNGDNTGQGSYDLCIAANPTNANEVYVGGINLWKSTNGGTAWSISNMWTSSNTYNSCNAPVVHADKHFLAFQNGTSTLFDCNDGGLFKTTFGGFLWYKKSNGIAISQIYRLGVSQTNPNEVVCGLQDNGTKLFSGSSWDDVKGGDGMECLIDYTDANVQYGTYTNGQLDRTTDHWSTRTNISDNIPGGNAGAWISPYVIDPVNNQTLYMGYSDVWKTTNRGNSWSKISTMNTYYGLRSMAISPSNNQVLYVADDDQIWRTTNGGSTWSDRTGSLPVWNSNITYVAVKDNNSNTAWVTFGGYNSTAVYQTTNGGSSWTNISAGLPSIPVMCIVQNKHNTDEIELYAGTDVGVYQKVGSGNWTPYSTGLPNVVVTELEIYYDDVNGYNSRLRAATYGRGLWESPLPSATSVKELTESGIKVYPNPAESILNIELPVEDVNVRLINMDGRVLRAIDSKQSKHLSLNIDELSSGIYTLILTTSDAKQVVRKVVRK